MNRVSSPLYRSSLPRPRRRPEHAEPDFKKSRRRGARAFGAPSLPFLPRIRISPSVRVGVGGSA